MNLFNTPKWKHRKADVRLAALNELDPSERDTVLANVASHDADVGVRTTALKLLTDLDLLDSLCGDPNTRISRAAEHRLKQLLCGDADVTIEVEHRQRFVRLCKNASMLENVIFNADDDNLKRHALKAAIELSNNKGLLQKVATQSDSAELRMFAVETISNGATLSKIIDPLKKIDKAAGRLAQSKLDEIQLRSGDQATMRQHQLSLCEALEALNNATPTTENLSQLQAKWDQLIALSPSSANEEMTERFVRGTRIAERIINPPEPVVEPEPAAEEPAAATAETQEIDDASDEPTDEQRKALHSASQRCDQLLKNEQSKSTFKQLTAASKALADAIGRIADDEHTEPARVLSSIVQSRISELDKQRSQALASAKTHIEALQSHINENAAGPARDAHKGLVASLKTARQIVGGKDIDAISDKLSALDSEYHKLVEAQHWSTTRVRRELAEKAEKLVGATIPPAELATLVKGLQAEWKKLDQIEHEHGPNSLRGRFSSACRKAWEPCADYFAKLDEQRKGDLEVVAQFIDQLQSLDPATMQINALLEKVELGGKVDRELRSYPAKIRGDWPKKLRAALKPLEKSRDRQWAANAATKKQLIDSAKALTELDDLRRATDQMKRLQADWKKTGPTRRKQNNVLWDEFRAAGDAVFSKLKQENNQRKAEQNKHGEFLQQQTEKLVALLEDNSAAQQLKQKLGNVQRDASDALDEAGRHPASKAFADAVSKVNKLVSQRKRDEAISALDPLREAAKARSEQANDDAEARDAVLLIEIAAGVDSPAQDSARRMELQLDRLSSSFGRADGSNQGGLLKLAEAWYKEHSAPTAIWAELDQRIQNVVKS